MVKPNETPTYLVEVQRREAALTKVETEFNEIDAFLKTVKRRRRGEPVDPVIEAKRKRRATLKDNVARRKNALAHLYDLTVEPWHQLHFIMDSDGSQWLTEAQRTTLWHKILLAHEGQGEASLRDWLGLPQQGASTEDCDILEVEWENKKIQGKGDKGAFILQVIQSSAAGRKAYGQWMAFNFEQGVFKDLPDDVRVALATGEVTREIMFGKLSKEVNDSLFQAVRPSVVFARPRAMTCATRYGFLLIPWEEYDQAWVFKCITKSSAKYALRREYLLERCRNGSSDAVRAAFAEARARIAALSASASQDGTNVAA